MKTYNKKSIVDIKWSTKYTQLIQKKAEKEKMNKKTDGRNRKQKQDGRF